MNILLGLTGSVASVLASKLRQELMKLGDVQVVMTDRTIPFLNDEGWCYYSDKDEWPYGYRYKKDDHIPHIDLRDWADVLIIAPCSANTMAKMANGLCDNLLTSIARAWDFTKPIIIAPAMNTLMWEHPSTLEHIKKLRNWNIDIVYPIEKLLACGQTGVGAMAKIESITEAVKNRQWVFPLKKCNGIPTGSHIGAFGAIRRNDIHTGVDLYCEEGEEVYAVEDGIIVGVAPFTGSKTAHDYYLDTDYMLVSGKSGVICYGEVKPKFGEYTHVTKGDVIATVTPVVKQGRERPDIQGHSRSMLHFELYRYGVTYPVYLPKGNKIPPYLKNPTNNLLKAQNAPTITFSETFKK